MMNGENKSHTPKTECDRCKCIECKKEKEYETNIRNLFKKINENFINE